MWKSLPPPLFKGKHHRICQRGFHEGREPRQKFYMEALKKEELIGEWAAGIKPPRGSSCWHHKWKEILHSPLWSNSGHAGRVQSSSHMGGMLVFQVEPFVSLTQEIHKNHKKLEWMVLADSHTTEGSFFFLLQPAAQVGRLKGSPQMLPSSRRQHFRVQEKAAAA